MAVKFLDNTGLGYFWGKIKAWCNSTFAAIAHTHTAYAVKHSYTTASNAAKNWYRIANANTSQTDTTKPIHAQFILTAYNASYDAGYYERWFVNAEVFGRTPNIVIFGNSQAPFSQARILYENTIADLDANDRPAIDIYLNNVLANGTTKIEIEEVYNQGWTFVADGQISASTVPTGFEGTACDALRSNGVGRSTYADYANVIGLQRSDITSNITLADNNTYRSRVLNCTGTRTITVPSINSAYSWFVIKNFNTTSGIITVHPSTTSVLIDGSNADITLQPGEYIVIHSRAANSYSIIADGRWKSLKANDADVVHKNANETLTGIKVIENGATYTNVSTEFPTQNKSELVIKNSLVTKGVTPSNLTFTRVSFVDSTNTGGPATFSDRLGCVECANRLDGSSEIQIVADKPDGSEWSAAVRVGYLADGVTTFCRIPSTRNDPVYNEAITYDWLPKDTRLVHTIGNESISGVKAFIADSNTELVLRNTGITTGTIPSANEYISLRFKGTETGSDRSFGIVQSGIYSNGAVRLYLAANQNVANNPVTGTITLQVNADGTTFAQAPSTLSTRTAGEDIVTRDWIPNDTRIVHTTGDETIGGSKVFGEWTRFVGATGAALVIDSTEAQLDTVPSKTMQWRLTARDKNSATIGIIRCLWETNGNREVTLGIKNTSDTYAVMKVGHDANNIPYAQAPSTSATRTSVLDVLTRDWIPKDTRIVHTTENETIAGLKTFSNTITQTYTGDYTIFAQRVNATKGTNPTDTGKYAVVGAFEASGNLYVANRISVWTGYVATSGDVYSSLHSYAHNSTGNSANFSCVYSTANSKAYQLSNMIRPHTNNAYSLGDGTYRYTQLFATNGTISTSDERLKHDIDSVSDKFLDIWESVEWKQFKMLKSVQEKGRSNARIHVGAVAQQILNAFSDTDIDISKYGFFCHDEWDQTQEVRGPEGEILISYNSYGDMYSIRYEEALCIEAAYQRRKNKILENRISELENQLSFVLQTLKELKGVG